MQKIEYVMQSIGKLVRGTRSQTMDQYELAQRSGVGRNTVSNIENGKSVNIQSLLSVLEQLGLIDELQVFIDQQISQRAGQLQRKSRTHETLNNDF